MELSRRFVIGHSNRTDRVLRRMVGPHYRRPGRSCWFTLRRYRKTGRIRRSLPDLSAGRRRPRRHTIRRPLHHIYCRSHGCLLWPGNPHNTVGVQLQTSRRYVQRIRDPEQPSNKAKRVANHCGSFFVFSQIRLISLAQPKKNPHSKQKALLTRTSAAHLPNTHITISTHPLVVAHPPCGLINVRGWMRILVIR